MELSRQFLTYNLYIRPRIIGWIITIDDHQCTYDIGFNSTFSYPKSEDIL